MAIRNILSFDQEQKDNEAVREIFGGTGLSLTHGTFASAFLAPYNKDFGNEIVILRP